MRKEYRPEADQMLRAHGARAAIDSIRNDEQARIADLIAFMDIIEGRKISRAEAIRALGIRR